MFFFLVPRLRSREKQMDEKPKPKKEEKSNKTKTIAVRRPKLMPTRCETVEIGQVILFKLTGFCEWPGYITNIDQNIAHIQFFGDQTVQKSKITNFYKFEDSSEIILFNLRKRKTPLYRKAVIEAEMALGIPETNSILNRI